jgi:peptidoglycan hydrolase-like protein with peptidoglycan-binding domain
MTSGQARVALGGFFLLAAGVAINALFLQPGPAALLKEAADRGARQPGERARKGAESPRVVSPQPSQPRVGPPAIRPAEERVARLKPDSASVDAAVLPAEPSADSEMISAIQRELKLHGYAGIGADGALNDPTRAAILAFEYDSGLPLAAEPTPAILKRLVLGASAGADVSAGAGSVRSPQAERLVRGVQQTLATLGYQPGPANGQLTQETRRAIREFELDRGLIPKGRISAEVLARLKESLAAVKPAAR